MSNHYEKDADGKYKLVKEDKQEPNVNVNKPQTKGAAFVKEVMEGPKIAELDARLRVLEKMLLGDRAKQ